MPLLRSTRLHGITWFIILSSLVTHFIASTISGANAWPLSSLSNNEAKSVKDGVSHSRDDTSPRTSYTGIHWGNVLGLNSSDGPTDHFSFTRCQTRVPTGCRSGGYPPMKIIGLPGPRVLAAFECYAEYPEGGLVLCLIPRQHEILSALELNSSARLRFCIPASSRRMISRLPMLPDTLVNMIWERSRSIAVSDVSTSYLRPNHSWMLKGILIASLMQCCDYKVERPDFDLAGLKCPTLTRNMEGHGPRVSNLLE